MTKRAVITVDGLAGAGKTALAHALAKRLGFVLLKSGMLYRAVGYLALRHKTDLRSGLEMQRLISAHTLELCLGEDGSSCVLVDGSDLGAALHKPEISEAASLAASLEEVRAALVTAQREAFSGHGLVAEGRDQGTVIFPDAELKFFVQADVEVRVMRRMAQLYPNHADFDAERLNSLKKEMEIEVVERDRRDLERSAAPTLPAADAIIIDNSRQTLTQLLQNMYDSAASRGLVKG